MSLLVETGDGIAGCLAVLGGRDLSKCYHDDLTGAVEAITGIPGHLYRFFYTNKKITSDLSLHDQGLLAGHRLNLHVTIRGGMPLSASDRRVSVKVTDLHSDVTQQELRSLFTRCGEVTSLNLNVIEGRKPKHAFVNFKTHEQALMAIQRFDKLPVRGKPIHCTLQAPKGTMQNATVFPVKVTNLDDSVTELDLGKLFSQFGRVVHLVIKAPSTGRFAFVNFLSESEQHHASSHLHGTLLGTKLISVSQQGQKIMQVSKDGATVGPSSSSAARGPSVGHGPQVLADSQMRPLGHAPVELPGIGSAMGVGSGAYGGVAGSGSGAFGVPTYSQQQCPSGLQPSPTAMPLNHYGVPPPVVTAVGGGTFRSLVMMSPEVYLHISPLIQVHVGTHMSYGTASHYTDGNFAVQGSDRDSVVFIASKAFDALRLLQ